MEYCQKNRSLIEIEAKEERYRLRGFLNGIDTEVIRENDRIWISIDAAYYGLKYQLPLADSIIYATAMKYDAIIWTQDKDFESLDRVKYFPKLDRK